MEPLDPAACAHMDRVYANACHMTSTGCTKAEVCAFLNGNLGGPSPPPPAQATSPSLFNADGDGQGPPTSHATPSSPEPPATTHGREGSRGQTRRRRDPDHPHPSIRRDQPPMRRRVSVLAAGLPNNGPRTIPRSVSMVWQRLPGFPAGAITGTTPAPSPSHSPTLSRRKFLRESVTAAGVGVDAGTLLSWRKPPSLPLPQLRFGDEEASSISSLTPSRNAASPLAPSCAEKLALARSTPGEKDKDKVFVLAARKQLFHRAITGFSPKSSPLTTPIHSQRESLVDDASGGVALARLPLGLPPLPSIRAAARPGAGSTNALRLQPSGGTCGGGVGGGGNAADFDRDLANACHAVVRVIRRDPQLAFERGIPVDLLNDVTPTTTKLQGQRARVCAVAKRWSSSTEDAAELIANVAAAQSRPSTPEADDLAEWRACGARYGYGI